MKRGVIEYDDTGKPRCHICGKSFDRVLRHVVQSHGMSAEKYKKKFGLNRNVGICSDSSSSKSSRATKKRKDIIEQNLIKGGAASRFTPGWEGRTKELLRMQEKYKLREWAKVNISAKRRKELGKALGLSGLGNKVRWGTGKINE